MKKHPLAALMFLTLFSCSNAGGETISSSYSEFSNDYSEPFSLKFYSNGWYIPFLQRACDCYVERYELTGKVSISVENYPDPCPPEDVDLWLPGQMWIPGMSWEKDFVKLSGRYADRLKKEFTAEALSGVSVNGEAYAFPFYMYSYGFFYDDRVLNAEDTTTLSSLVTALEAVDGGAKLYYQYDNFWFLDAFLSSYDVFVQFEKDTEGNVVVKRDDVGTEKGKEALLDFARLTHEHDVLTNDYRVSRDKQAREDVAAYIGTNDLFQTVEAEGEGHIVCGPMPKAKGKVSLPYYQTSIGVLNHDDPRKVLEATRLADYLTSAEVMTAFADELDTIPANTVALEKTVSPFVRGCAEDYQNAYSAKDIWGIYFLSAYGGLMNGIASLPDDYVPEDLDPLIQTFGEMIRKG